MKTYSPNLVICSPILKEYAVLQNHLETEIIWKFKILGVIKNFEGKSFHFYGIHIAQISIENILFFTYVWCQLGRNYDFYNVYKFFFEESISSPTGATYYWF